jgi:hypothetical protein
MTVPGMVLAAMDACKYVASHMRIGADNDIATAARRLFFGHVPALVCVRGVMRPAIDKAIADGRVQSFNGNRIMEITAEKAKKHGCGNCGEQSAMAFVYLRNKAIGPLDWAQFTNRDHAFVLMGRPSTGTPGNLNEWVDNLVVCDPYYNRAAPLGTVSQQYNLAFISSMLHYENGVTL